MKHTTLDTEVSADDLWAVVVHVVQDGYEIGGLCHEERELLFRSGRTALSWGHQHVAGVKAQGAGSVLQLTVAGVPGAPRALLDGRKNQKAMTRLVEAVQAALAASPRPVPAPVASYAMMADGSTVPWTSGEFPGA